MPYQAQNLDGMMKIQNISILPHYSHLIKNEISFINIIFNRL